MVGMAITPIDVFVLWLIDVSFWPTITAPTWLPLVVAFILAIVKRRFSLASLFVLMTIEAIGLISTLWIIRSLQWDFN